MLLCWRSSWCWYTVNLSQSLARHNAWRWLHYTRCHMGRHYPAVYCVFTLRRVCIIRRYCLHTGCNHYNSHTVVLPTRYTSRRVVHHLRQHVYTSYSAGLSACSCAVVWADCRRYVSSIWPASCSSCQTLDILTSKHDIHSPVLLNCTASFLVSKILMLCQTSVLCCPLITITCSMRIFIPSLSSTFTYLSISWSPCSLAYCILLHFLTQSSSLLKA